MRWKGTYLFSFGPFLFWKEGSSKKRAFCLRGEKMIKDRYLPLAYLDGNQFEISYSHQASSVVKKEEWDSWKNQFTTATDDYRTVVYPSIAAVLAMFAKLPINDALG